MPKLTKTDKKELVKLEEEYLKKHQQFLNRVHEIIQLIHKACGITERGGLDKGEHNWWIEGAEEGSPGEIDIERNKMTNIDYQLETEKRILGNLNYTFPEEWLYMPDKKIIKEIRDYT